MSRRHGWLLLLSLLGCSAGQTGGEIDGEDCEESTLVLGRATTSDLGFSADEVLAFAEGTHETEWIWIEPEPTRLLMTPSSGTTRMNLTVKSAGNIRYVASHPKTPEVESQCRGRVEIDVNVKLSTADGAFDEDTLATIVAMARDRVALEVELETAQLNGSFHAEPVDAPQFRVESLTIPVTLGPGKMVGHVLPSVIQHDSRGATSIVDAEYLARFGTGTCPDGYLEQGLFGDVSTEPGKVDTDSVSVPNANSPLAIQWQDGSTAQLSVQATELGTPACLAYAHYLVEPYGSTKREVLLTMTSDDGRIDAQWPVTATGIAASGIATEELRFELFSKPFEVSELLPTFGMSGVDFGTDSFAYVVFGMSYADFSTQPRVTGSLDVWSLPSPRFEDSTLRESGTISLMGGQ